MTTQYAAPLLLLLAALQLNLQVQNEIAKRLSTPGTNASIVVGKHGAGNAEVLHFEGTVALPSKTTTFSVLDYLTIYDSTLYVAGMSTGTLDVVRLNNLQLSKGTIDAHAGEIAGLKGAMALQ